MGQKTEIEKQTPPGSEPPAGQPTEPPAAPATEPAATPPDGEHAEPTAEEREAEEAFGAGFHEARGDEPPAEIPAPQDTPPAKPAAKEKRATKEKEKPPAPTPAPASEPPAEPQGTPIQQVLKDLDPEQLRRLVGLLPTLEKYQDDIRKVYGRFGEIQSALQQLQQARTSRATKIALKRMREEFPEVTDALEADMAAAEAEAQPPAQPAQPAQPAAPAEPAAPSAGTPSQDGNEAMDRKMLTLFFPNWEADCNTPEFVEFMKTMAATDQQRYLESTDSVVTAECFRKFYAWRDAKQAPEPPATDPTKTSTRKQERLERAITPTGEGPPTDTVLDEEAAFQHGFNEARQGR